MNQSHRPVLLAEAVSSLTAFQHFPFKTASIIDGTFGRGGHTQALLNQLGKEANLIAFDKDPQAIAEGRLIQDKRLQLVHDSFANLDQYATSNSIDAVLLDLGISSPQIDQAERGFSFRFDGPLDMRMDTTRGVTAATWLQEASLEEITHVIKTYGEERFAFAIAKAIVAKRLVGESPKTTRELSNLVAGAVRTREPGQDPATRTFQALRMVVNRELEDLEQGLTAALKVLKIGGRLVVISFHSLEDRIVKRFMQAHVQVEVPRKLPIREKDLPQGDLNLIARIRPSDQEVIDNPRARSAMMRVAEKKSGGVLV
jgi:16S rRNA (cytosine1402-N4)-methyltransferase